LFSVLVLDVELVLVPQLATKLVLDVKLVLLQRNQFWFGSWQRNQAWAVTGIAKPSGGPSTFPLDFRVAQVLVCLWFTLNQAHNC